MDRLGVQRRERSQEFLRIPLVVPFAVVGVVVEAVREGDLGVSVRKKLNIVPRAARGLGGGLHAGNGVGPNLRHCGADRIVGAAHRSGADVDEDAGGRKRGGKSKEKRKEEHRESFHFD
jgi:hypothetical protein